MSRTWPRRLPSRPTNEKLLGIRLHRHNAESEWEAWSPRPRFPFSLAHDKTIIIDGEAVIMAVPVETKPRKRNAARRGQPTCDSRWPNTAFSAPNPPASNLAGRHNIFLAWLRSRQRPHSRGRVRCASASPGRSGRAVGLLSSKTIAAGSRVTKPPARSSQRARH